MSSISVANTAGNALALAAVFSYILETDVAPVHWGCRRAEQLAANATGEGICRAHEWCDPSEVMFSAFAELGWASWMDERFSIDGDHTAAWDGEPGQLERRAWSLADACAWDGATLAQAWRFVATTPGDDRGDKVTNAMRQIEKVTR